MIVKGRDEENIKELFEKFLNSEQANQAVEDIRKGERILGEHPASEPDKKLIANIKSEIAEAILRRKANTFRRVAYKAAGVAAVFIIVATISVISEKGGGEAQKAASASVIPAAIWESEDIAADDADLAILTAEIEQIEGEVLAVQLGENGGNGHEAITEVEMELIEINSDFWKG